MTSEFDYYQILGVDRRATPDKIRQAFAARQTSQAGAGSTADPTYRRVVQAYEVLSDPERRAVYDSLLAETILPALRIEVQASRSQIGLSDAAQLVYLLVSVYPPEEESRSQHPLNLSLVIDRSTSMQGDRLDYMRAAVELIIERLGPEDTISIISFSDRAEVVFPSGQIENKQALLSQLRSMYASGGTEIYQGLAAGLKEIEKLPLAKHTNHLILLTDGHTYGDAEACLQLAESASRQGIGLSAFGLGMEWNDQFLDKLVSPSGGKSDYIEAPTQIIDFLQSRIKGLGAVYARNVRLAPELPRNVQLNDGFKLVPFAQPLALDRQEIHLGDMEARGYLSFLLELSIAPQSVETRITIPLTLTADIPSQQAQPCSFKHQSQLFVLAHPAETDLPRALIKAVRALNLYRMNEKVWHEVEAGELDGAVTRMRRLTTRLLEAGETRLAQQAHAEAERLSQAGSLSPEGRKKLKYGTRALMQSLNLDSE